MRRKERPRNLSQFKQKSEKVSNKENHYFFDCDEGSNGGGIEVSD